jgi:hypothetical protein
MYIKDLKKEDIGKTVFYVPSFGDPEMGILKSWNDKFIFVVYPGNNDVKKEHWDRYTAAATNPDELFWNLPKE